MVGEYEARDRQMADQREDRISHFYRPTLVDVDTRSHVFDPTRDRQAWNKWRIAVNNILMDNVKLREQHKQLNGYSHSLTEAPFSEYLLVTRGTRISAKRLMTPTQRCVQHDNEETSTCKPGEPTLDKRTLKTGQFLYYGIPRIVIKK